MGAGPSLRPNTTRERGNLTHAKSNLADKKRFLKFIMEFQEGNYAYKYRDALKRNYMRQEYKLEINTRDLAGYGEQLADKLKESPGGDDALVRGS